MELCSSSRHRHLGGIQVRDSDPLYGRTIKKYDECQAEHNRSDLAVMEPCSSLQITATWAG